MKLTFQTDETNAKYGKIKQGRETESGQRWQTLVQEEPPKLRPEGEGGGGPTRSEEWPVLRSSPGMGLRVGGSAGSLLSSGGQTRVLPLMNHP